MYIIGFCAFAVPGSGCMWDWSCGGTSRVVAFARAAATGGRASVIPTFSSSEGAGGCPFCEGLRFGSVRDPPFECLASEDGGGGGGFCDAWNWACARSASLSVSHHVCIPRVGGAGDLCTC